MTTHAKLSPSKRDRWSRCPASVKAEAQYPEEDRASNKAAVDGTHSHTLLAHCIENHLSALDMIDIKLSDDDGEFVVDAERAERVEVALKYLDLRMRSLSNPKLYSEVKLNLAPVFGRDDLNGTSDIVILSDDVIEVADYKDGRGAVDVVENPQLDQYAWGVIAQLGDLSKITAKSIRTTIIQPKMRNEVTGHGGVTFYETTIDEFLRGKDRLAAEAAATDAENPAFVPGEKQCQWCRHKGSCQALVQQNMGALGIDLSKMNVAQDAADKDPATMTDQQLRELIEAAPLIRKMLDAAEEEALARLEKGQSIEGLKLVRGRGSRGWAYKEEVMSEKLVKLGIPKGEIYKTTLISPAQAEKLTWKKRDGTVKQLSERQLKVLHDEYVTKNDGKLQVASVADERPAVVRDVSSMFGALPTLEQAAAAFNPVPVVEAPLPDFLQVPDWLK